MSGSTSEFRLVVLRHGETEWSKAHKHTGRTDIALTTAGEQQARAAREVLAGLGLADPLVLCSPRQRAVRTAELAGLADVRIDDDLVEWDYGDYEGLTTPQIRESVPGWTIFTDPAPGGESAAQVQARADRVLAKVEPELQVRDVVLVGHGHFSRCLIARWAEFEVCEARRFYLSTAGISVLGHEHGTRTILAHNLVPATSGGAR
ncbi:acid phosphatase [Nocardia miyunensis]|uniref:acid phosphatase n=1 Tax=Nocardia miyunensis TaxID=282684 RepID=UPI00082F5721|nr:acid phosphatase [Nocardia miyunensis]